MASVSLETFFTDVAIHVPACPEPVMAHAVRNAAIEFCKDSLVWRETLDAETLSASDFPYDLPTTQGGVTTAILDLRIDGRSIAPISEVDLNKAAADWRTATGTPTRYFMPSPDTLSVYTLPDSSISFMLSVAYMPTRTTTVVPSFLHTRYAPGIAAGALAQLFALPEKPWTNPAAAAMWSNVFGAKKAEAKASAQRSFTAAHLVVDMRRHW